ncbi:MAG TPA: hypothetical protein DD465_22390 [Thalassospira sp.]|nr:hypothetical protein [Thalassospira sp.]
MQTRGSGFYSSKNQRPKNIRCVFEQIKFAILVNRENIPPIFTYMNRFPYLTTNLFLFLRHHGIGTENHRPKMIRRAAPR